MVNTITKTDIEFVKALRENKTIYEALKELNLHPSGANYRKAKNIIDILRC